MRNSTSLLFSLVTISLASAAPRAWADETAKHGKAAKKSLTVTSDAFKANEAIPSDYTCDGAEKSPPLSWSGVPSNAQSIAILVEDPDAPKGTFTHWIVTGIPASTTSIDENGALPQGAVAAKNDKGAMGYAGPCPPSGTHHYHFHVFALDTSIAQPASRAELEKSIKGHVIAKGELVGTYAKQTAAKPEKPAMKPEKPGMKDY